MLKRHDPSGRANEPIAAAIRPSRPGDIGSGNPACREERTAINTVIQGSAADLIKLAMIAIDRRLRRENGSARQCCCKSTTNWSSKHRPTNWTAG